MIQFDFDRKVGQWNEFQPLATHDCWQIWAAPIPCNKLLLQDSICFVQMSCWVPSQARGIFHGSMIIVIESFFLACKPLSHRYLITSEFVSSAFCQQFENMFFLLPSNILHHFTDCQRKDPNSKKTCNYKPPFLYSSRFHFQPPFGKIPTDCRRDGLATFSREQSLHLQGSTVTWRLWTSAPAAAGPMMKPSNSRGRAERQAICRILHQIKLEQVGTFPNFYLYWLFKDTWCRCF